MSMGGPSPGVEEAGAVSVHRLRDPWPLEGRGTGPWHRFPALRNCGPGEQGITLRAGSGFPLRVDGADNGHLISG